MKTEPIPHLPDASQNSDRLRDSSTLGQCNTAERHCPPDSFGPHSHPEDEYDKTHSQFPSHRHPTAQQLGKRSPWANSMVWRRRNINSIPKLFRQFKQSTWINCLRNIDSWSAPPRPRLSSPTCTKFWIFRDELPVPNLQWPDKTNTISWSADRSRSNLGHIQSMLLPLLPMFAQEILRDSSFDHWSAHHIEPVDCWSRLVTSDRYTWQTEIVHWEEDASVWN